MTTLIERIVFEIAVPTTGFFTREIREKGRRVRFSINTLDGKQGVLAHQNIRSKYRVGKYGVNLEDIDHIAVPSMVSQNEEMMVIIDEIGKMECFSSFFKETVIRIPTSQNRSNCAFRYGFLRLATDSTEQYMLINSTV